MTLVRDLAPDMRAGPPLFESLPIDMPTIRWPQGADRAGDLDLTVVVPYYNPGDTLRRTIDGLIEALSATELQYEIIAVSDGSTDGSELSLLSCPPSLVHNLILEVNQGKGQALRTGLQCGRGRLLAFIDADGDLPPHQITGMVQIAQSENPHVLVGSKRHADSRIHSSWHRRIYSSLWQKVVSTPFRLGVRDTQTGLKVIRRDVVLDALPLTVETGFAFDLELLVVARRLGYKRFLEAPVEIVERSISTVSIRTAVRMLGQAAAIFVRRYVNHSYDPVSAARPVLRLPARASLKDSALIDLDTLLRDW
jgi:glycosyltransferase involved in cell wall biosynthesis